MSNQLDGEKIQILLPSPDWIKRAHPMLMLFNGGYKAKAGADKFGESDRPASGKVAFNVNKNNV